MVKMLLQSLLMCTLITISLAAPQTTEERGQDDQIHIQPSTIFQSPNGNAITVPEGIYRVENSGENGLRLVAAGDGLSITIKAKRSHFEEGDVSESLSFLSCQDGNLDCHLLLLRQNGDLFDASGYRGESVEIGFNAINPLGREQISKLLQDYWNSPRDSQVQERGTVLRVTQKRQRLPSNQLGTARTSTNQRLTPEQIASMRVSNQQAQPPEPIYSLDASDGDPQKVLHLDANGKVEIGFASLPSRYNFDAASFQVRGYANPTATSPIRYVGRFSNSAGSGSGVIIQAGYKHSSAKAIEILRLASFDGPAEFIFFNDGRSSGLSDRRLKQNVTTIENALVGLEKIHGVTFEWRDKDGRQIGLIAQEVEGAFPELVTETDGYKGIDYTRFSAVLVQAVRELKSEMDTLKKVNQELGKRIKDLEGQN